LNDIALAPPCPAPHPLPPFPEERAVVRRKGMEMSAAGMRITAF